MNYFLLAFKSVDSSLDAFLLSNIAIISTVLMIFVGYKLLQMLQLTGYKLKGYISWFKETKYSYVSRLFMLTFLSLASMLMTNVLLEDFFIVRPLKFIGILFYILFSSLFITNLFTAKQKTPLKYTRRMTRLLIVYTLIVAVFTFLVEVVGFLYVPYISYGLIGVIPIMIPLFVFLAYFITYPLEKVIANSYLKKAKKNLASHKNIIVIGITGSYGKTSVKNILKTILSEKYKVCASPSSYNTPLGLSKTILSNLAADDEIFIAEMGAKQRYDIKELAQMVKPTYGIITGVGNQHLLTFGNEDNIIETKSELANYITEVSGKLYINTESEKTEKLAKNFKNAIKISISKEDSKLKIKNIKTTKEGSSFELELDNVSKKCKTVLLGEHNISNILLASRVAIDLGLTLDDIVNGISKLASIPHRLEVVKSLASYTIIDNAYNSSVEGSKASLKVLQNFDGQKIVITPGLVELGSEQFNANFEFGIDMAKYCDYVIIDSAINYDAIAAGLEFGGFDVEKIIQVGNLSQAVAMVNTIAKQGDVVLFENDLPDNYS